jgi:hypothetical protein
LKRRRRGGAEGFSLSFLDVICCGFGAVILLLVLTKIGEPQALERSVRDLDALIAKLQEELHEIVGETVILNRDLVSKQEQKSEEQTRIARLRGDLSNIRGEFATTKQFSEVNEKIEGQLLAAQQAMTEEMQRLASQRRRKPVADRPVGGIPVDSEYVIFVIDTSGSMASYTWGLVVEKMQQVLNIYPKVKGIQVMNDMGQYMFSQYAGKWIPDTPARRRAIVDRLRGWNAFSNSSPVEGISRAIQGFAAPDKKVSIYVFGDEFTGDSVQEVLDAVDRINRADARGQRRVRVHAIGFPVVFSARGVSEYTGVRFATLMRQLCRENNGTFVGLTEIRP